MDGSKAKKYAEEIKKEINGLIPTVENKEKLINQLCEKDEENGGHYVQLIENANEAEELNHQENTQNSTKDTTNKMSSEASNPNESGFNSSSNKLSTNSYCNDEKKRNDDNTELIENIADRILEILEYELSEEDEETRKNFLMEVFGYFNCKH